MLDKYEEHKSKNESVLLTKWNAKIDRIFVVYNLYMLEDFRYCEHLSQFMRDKPFLKGIVETQRTFKRMKMCQYGFLCILLLVY